MDSKLAVGTWLTTRLSGKDPTLSREKKTRTWPVWILVESKLLSLMPFIETMIFFLPSISIGPIHIQANSIWASDERHA